MTLIKTASLLGSLTIAAVLSRFGPARLLPLAFFVAALALAVGVHDAGTFASTIAMLAFVSFFVDGAFSGIVGFVAYVFPDRVCATSIGLTTGLARLSGGTLGPMLGGILVAAISGFYVSPCCLQSRS